MERRIIVRHEPASLLCRKMLTHHAVRGTVCLLMVVATFSLWPAALFAQLPEQIGLEPPAEREFVLDRANMIGEADEEKIKQRADALLTEKAAPIVVVTIESMAEYGGGGLRIETFARLLFDQWGVGHEKIGETPWNYGILLLVSKQLFISGASPLGRTRTLSSRRRATTWVRRLLSCSS